MLLAIGLILVYVDIEIGHIDLIPDIMGYALLFPGLIASRRFLKKPALMLSLLGANIVLELLNLIPTGLIFINAVSYFALVLLNAVFVLLLIRSLKLAWPKEERAWPVRVSLANTCVKFTLICQIAGIPITWFTAGNVFIQVSCAACGL